MKKDYVFISYSQRVTHGVAQVIEKIISAVYPKETTNVEIFLSSKKISAGRFKDQILGAMKNAKFAISILTPENHNAPWLMYEAGALSLAVAQNGGHLMPYLFCRHGQEIESTIEDLQYAQYQRDYPGNQDDLSKLIVNLNACLSKENQVSELDIRSKIDDLWPSISEKLNNISLDLKYYSASSEEKTLNSSRNDYISISPLEGNLSTNEQCHIRIADDFSPITPKDIEDRFKQIVDFYIPDTWKHKNAIDNQYDETRVIVNSSRFSTFVIFTDGSRVVLFDRAKDQRNTNVLNDRYDVFGSVQFENGTLKNKIKSKDFLDSKIIRTEEISGAAIEDNRLKIGKGAETAIMFGVCVYMDPKDLDLAKDDTANNEVIIRSVSSLYKMKQSLLTSKATLGISHIIKNNINKNAND